MEAGEVDFLRELNMVLAVLNVCQWIIDNGLGVDVREKGVGLSKQLVAMGLRVDL